MISETVAANRINSKAIIQYPYKFQGNLVLEQVDEMISILVKVCNEVVIIPMEDIRNPGKMILAEAIKKTEENILQKALSYLPYHNG